MAGWLAAPNAGRIPASAFYSFNGDIATVSGEIFFESPYKFETVQETINKTETFDVNCILIPVLEDILTITETFVDGIFAYFLTLTDAITATDIAGDTAIDYHEITDGVNVTDSVLRIQAINIEILRTVNVLDFVARGVGTFTSDSFNTSDASSYDRVSVRRFEDLVRCADPLKGDAIYNLTLAEFLRVIESISRVDNLALIENATLTPTLTNFLYKTERISERITALDEFLSKGFYNLASSDTLQILDKILFGIPIFVLQEMTVNDVVRLATGIRILEKLNLNVSSFGNTIHTLSFVDRMRLFDSLSRFISGDVSDTLNLTAAVLPKFFLTRAVSEAASVGEALVSSLLFRVEAAETINLNDFDVLKHIFNPVLTEKVSISAAHVSPNDTFTTWAVNTSTGAVTEYTNYAFNSFAELGGYYFGSSETGLYSLTGDDDHGEDIIARIKSGLAQFGGSRLASLKGVYLGLRGEGNWVLKIITGDGKEYIYSVVGQNMQTTKVRLGKGLRARYFSYELISVGQDFDLESIEFIPLVAQRRV